MAYSCTSFPSCENSCGGADAREHVPPGFAFIRVIRGWEIGTKAVGGRLEVLGVWGKRLAAAFTLLCALGVLCG